MTFPGPQPGSSEASWLVALGGWIPMSCCHLNDSLNVFLLLLSLLIILIAPARKQGPEESFPRACQGKVGRRLQRGWLKAPQVHVIPGP